MSAILPKTIFNDPRIIEYSIDYSMNIYNSRPEAIATIKMRVDSNDPDIKNLLSAPDENTFGTILKEGSYVVLKTRDKKYILGDISDPESYKKIYMYYIDDLYSK